MGRTCVSVMFTDIVGSTEARARLGDDRADELRREHDHLVTELVAAHGGRVIKNLGDGLLAVCADPVSTVSAACGAQRRLRTRNASGGELLQIRVGISFGEVSEEDDDVFGMTVVEAARLCGLAAADQILVTESVAAEAAPVSNCVSAGTALLKGIPDPVPIAAIRWVGDAPVGLPMGAGAVALAGTDQNGPRSAVGNVPSPLDETVGRVDEIEELREVILGGERVVTIVGPGGAGKTRLALEVARSLLSTYRDGVWFVDLTAIRSGTVAEHVAQVLDLTDEGTVQPAQKLIEHCAARELLLVLDNCEHVVADVNELVRDLAMLAPRVQILATSMVALGVGGERQWRCPVLAESEALDLLVTRARSAGAEIDPADPDLGEACVRLDRLPLAIELVAPRLRAWTPTQLCNRLEQNPHSTGRAAPGTPRRHESMEALVDWSVDLLDDRQAMLFRRLAVFRGSFNLDAVVEVCGFDPIDPLDVDVLVADLADHSLVRVQTTAVGRRYNLLRPIRDHAVDQLGQFELEELNRRLHRRLVTVFAESRDDLLSANQVEASARLDLLVDDLRAVLQRDQLVSASDKAELLIAAGAYLLHAGILNEARSQILAVLPDADRGQQPALWVLLARIESGLDRPDLAVRAGRAALEALAVDAAPSDQAEALLVTADPRSSEMTPQERLRLLDAAADLARRASNDHLLAQILGSRQWALDDAGNPVGGLASAEEAVALSENVGDIALHALLLDGMAHSYCTQGQARDAVDAAAEGLELARTVGRRTLVGRLLGTHANAMALAGDGKAAKESAADALSIAVDIGDTKLEGNTRCYLAEAQLALGAFDEALVVMLERPVDRSGSADPRKELMATLLTGWAAVGAGREELATEALELGLQFVGEVPVLMPVLVELGAAVVCLTGDHHLSARLLGAIAAEPQPGRAEVGLLQRAHASTVASLGDEECARLFDAGRAMEIEAAIAELTSSLASAVGTA